MDSEKSGSIAFVSGGADALPEAEDKRVPSRLLKAIKAAAYKLAYLRLLNRLQKTGLVGRCSNGPSSASGW